jgi:NTE family protein
MGKLSKCLDDELDIILNKKISKCRDILVLSGGSEKGFAQLGALHCLEINGFLENIKTISCTSVGSIIGVMYLVGYRPIEIFNLIKMIDYEKAMKINTNIFIKTMGLNDGKKILTILEKVLESKNIKKNINFRELEFLTKKKLIITGTCVEDKKICYFSDSEHGDMKVLDAIRISISIPILFTPLKHNGNFFIDGACIDIYPISLFDDSLDRVIGIFAYDDYQNRQKIKDIESYLTSTINCMLFSNIQKSLKGYEKCTISIKCNKSKKNKEEMAIHLFDKGYSSALEKFDLFRSNVDSYP